MMMIMIPLVALYEASILIDRRFGSPADPHDEASE
jgi:Sec-independent protein secretion pathway component TatC